MLPLSDETENYLITGEMSYANGEIYIKNIRSAANTDTYTFSGDPNGETFVPSFTSHGFRYVEITGKASSCVWCVAKNKTF